jgi:hypothetical protein
VSVPKLYATKAYLICNVEVRFTDITLHNVHRLTVKSITLSQDRDMFDPFFNISKTFSMIILSDDHINLCKTSLNLFSAGQT